VTVGAAFTVKTLVPVPMPASPFVTVTLRAPVVEPVATLRFAVREVALLKVTEFTAIPEPEKEIASDTPLTKPLPLMVMFWFDAPWPRELGLVEVTLGAGLTVKMPLALPTPASPLVTVMFRPLVFALELIEMLTVSCVGLTKLVELIVIPFPEKEAASDAPLTKSAPVTVMSWLVAP
jgi:hypothetical protein